METDTISKQQQIESQINSNKFKYQRDQIERLSKDLEDARQQIKGQKGALSDQKDALLQEAEKRQQVENTGKSIQISLVDIKAEADAIKQDIKGWQKDYVSVLAEFAQKMDDVQKNINSLKADIEKKMEPAKNENQP
jgi:septation ring formation regulator EzrA